MEGVVFIFAVFIFAYQRWEAKISLILLNDLCPKPILNVILNRLWSVTTEEEGRLITIQLLNQLMFICFQYGNVRALFICGSTKDQIVICKDQVRNSWSSCTSRYPLNGTTFHCLSN